MEKGLSSGLHSGVSLSIQYEDGRCLFAVGIV